MSMCNCRLIYLSIEILVAKQSKSYLRHIPENLRTWQLIYAGIWRNIFDTLKMLLFQQQQQQQQQQHFLFHPIIYNK